jgi:hypothetical protein
MSNAKRVRTNENGSYTGEVAFVTGAGSGIGRPRDGAAFVFAVLFDDHVYRKPELRKLLEEHLYPDGKFTARYLRRCEQLHKR